MGYTTGQFIAFIRRTITDNTARLNTAAVVRSVLERLGMDYFNKESDTLPIGSVSGLSSALLGKADLVGGKVPAAQLPSYVDDVVEFDTVALMQAQAGERGKIYVITTGVDAEKQFRWTGTIYTPSGGGTSVAYTDADARAAQLNRVSAGTTVVTLAAESPEDYGTADAGAFFTINPAGCQVNKFVRFALSATAGQPVFNPAPAGQPYKFLGATYGPNKEYTFAIYVCSDRIEVLIILD